MSAKPSGEVKTRQVRVRQKNGDIYVLERQTIYDPVKKYDKVIRSKLIGKIPYGQDTMVPTRAKRPNGAVKEEKATKLNAKRTHIGMMQIIDHIGKASGIDEAIYSITDMGTAQKILSLARYLLATNGQTLPGIETWQLNHTIPYEYGITQDIYHDLFRRIGIDESIQQNFFQARCSKISKTDSIAYDSTTISTYSGQIAEARYGFNKAGDGLKTVKYLTLYSIESRQPIAFTKQAGNLPDVISLKNALKELEVLGMPAAEIVTDNGFYSENNLSLMLQNHFNFITLVKNSVSWVKKELDEHMDDLNDPANICPCDPEVYAVTVSRMHEFCKEKKKSHHEAGASQKDAETFKRRIYIHIYFNRTRQAEERVRLDRELSQIVNILNQGYSVESLPEQSQKMARKYLIITQRGQKTNITYNKSAFQQACKYHGCFVLISNKEKDSSECLRKYRSRERIEAYFAAEKQLVDGTRTRVWNGDALRGRMFVQFVALCYYEYFSEQIRLMKEKLESQIISDHLPLETKVASRKLKSWLDNTPLYLQLQWFDTVEEVSVSSPIQKKRWTTEMTQRDLLYLNMLKVELE